MKQITRIVSILFLSFFTLISGLALTELQRQHNYLAEHGETVEAVVTHVQVTTSTKRRNGKNRTSKKVRPTLSFTNAAGLKKQIVYTGQGLSKDIVVGDVKTLRYLPGNPGMHVIMEFRPQWLLLIIAGVALLIGLVGLRYTIWGKIWSRHYKPNSQKSPHRPLVGFLLFGFATFVLGFYTYYFSQGLAYIRENSTTTTGVVTGFQAPVDGKGPYLMNIRYRDNSERTATTSLRQPLMSMPGENPYPRVGDRIELLIPTEDGKPSMAIVVERELPLFLLGLGLGTAIFLVSSLSNLFFWIRR